MVLNQARPSDTKLLQDFIGMLKTTVECSENDSYTRRLCEMSQIMMDVVTARLSQRKRRKSGRTAEAQEIIPSHQQMQNSPNHTEMSDLFLSSYSEQSYTSPGSLDFENQSLQSDVFSEPHESYMFTQSSNQNFQDMALGSENGVMPSTGNCAGGYFEGFDTLAYGLEASRRDFDSR